MDDENVIKKSVATKIAINGGDKNFDYTSFDSNLFDKEDSADAGNFNLNISKLSSDYQLVRVSKPRANLDVLPLVHRKTNSNPFNAMGKSPRFINMEDDSNGIQIPKNDVDDFGTTFAQQLSNQRDGNKTV